MTPTKSRQTGCLADHLDILCMQHIDQHTKDADYITMLNRYRQDIQVCIMMTTGHHGHGWDSSVATMRQDGTAMLDNAIVQ